LSARGGAVSPTSDSAAAAAAEDMGAYLSRSYGASSSAGGGDDDSAPISGGTLPDALASARSRARLLVVYVPASKPSSKKGSGGKYDRAAVSSLLSGEVRKVADRKARKKEEYGCFDLYSAKKGTSEANAAIKVLRAKKPGKGTSPYLMVCYGAQGIDSSGRPRIIPKLLAQHHCNPPPSPASMASWLGALRKRHAREYASMHHSLREERYHRERTEGYRSSANEDRDRERREKEEEEERARKEREERERLKMLEKRREELRESLPDEPAAGAEGAITVALRFADGRTGRRRFAAAETELDVLFNWADAVFGVEREKVELSTMNGSKRFRYAGECSETLDEAGLGKMVGLRVTQLEEDEEESEEPDQEDESEDEDEEED